MGRRARISGSEINLDLGNHFFGLERKSTFCESITMTPPTYQVLQFPFVQMELI
jgi:hypothetical protein